MANYQNLKAAISAAIRTNGNQEITGQVLQDVLNSIVSVIGANYTFAGVATPATNPGTPDQNVMYLAMEGGTYTNFNGTVLPAGISLLMWNGSWTSETVMYGDGGVFDISVYKSSGGTLATFADLSAALDGGNNIPASARKGGMSVKFVQSSDNKYVQCRLMSDDWSTTITDWQMVDKRPTLRSHNLLESGGVATIDERTSFIRGYNLFDKNQTFRNGYIFTDGTFKAASSDYLCTYNIPIKKNVWYTIGVVGNSSNFASLWLGARNGDNNNAINFTVQKYGSTEETGNFVDFANPGPVKFKVNEDDPYIAFTVKFGTQQDGRNYIVLIEGEFDAFPTTYKEYGFYVPKENISAEYKAEIQLELEKKAEYIKELSKNLINPNDVQLGAYISYSSEVIQPNQPRSGLSGAACSGLIPVTAGETYFLTRGASSVNGSLFCFIKEDGTTSVYPLDPETDETLTFSECNNKSRAYKAPSDAKYALICLALTGWNDTATQIYGYQFELGDVATDYEPYSEPSDIIPTEHLPKSIISLPNEVSEIEEQVSEIIVSKDKLFVFSGLSGGESYIQSYFDATNDIRNSFAIKREKGGVAGVSECFNFLSTNVINRSSGVSTSVDSVTDDICPVNFGIVGGFVGANHGYDRFYRLTAENHGKTYADIGSVYSKDGNTFVILDIEDSDKLIIGGEATSEYPIWNTIPAASTGTYTHSSGGTNTGDIIATVATAVQGKPVEKLDDTFIIVDGKRVDDTGEYMFADKVVICQNYKIVNYSSILSVLKSNAGSYTEHPDYSELSGVEYCAKLSISYIFTDAAHCFVAQNISYLQYQKLGYFGFMQKASLRNSLNTRLYIPKVLQIGSIDFRTNPLYNENTLTETINITSDKWENPNLPPDRFVVNDERVAFSGGYLFDYGVGGDKRKDCIANAFYLYSGTRKIYPLGIDKDGVGENQVKGNNYSSVCFRNYSPLGIFNQGGKLLINTFEYGGKFYIYADFNSAGVYEVEIPNSFIGKNVTTFENSTNVKLLTEVASNTILIQVETASPMYGYFVGKIE